MSEVILRRRNPLDVIRYVLQNLEKQAIAAGSYPTLIHEGLEAEEKVRAEVERLRAEAWAGHREDCGGIDEVEGRCACGWLQHESAHDYILNLTRERDEARAEVERLRELIVALSEDERGLVTGEVHAEADRIRAALRGGGESKAHADDCPCVMCDPMQVRLDQQLSALRGGGE